MEVPFRPRHLRSWLKVLAVLVLSSFVALEIWARAGAPWQNRTEIYDERGDPTKRDIDHPVLGYAPEPDHKFHMITYYQDVKAVDFSYTIDRNGLRASSTASNSDSNECVLFFGGSTPFGEGVQDDQTVPYLVEEMAHGQFDVYNFGYFYYGGHQMLAGLERGLIDDTINCVPTHAIYFGFVAHAERAVFKGVPYLERNGPMYVVGPDGEPIRYVRPSGITALMKMLNWSRVLKKVDRILVSSIQDKNLSKGDLDLYAAIVENAKRVLESKYHGIEFDLIFWNEMGQPASDYLLSKFNERGLKIYLISEIFPEYDFQKTAYSLGPGYMINDTTWHMNAKAYRTIAGYIVANILQES